MINLMCILIYVNIILTVIFIIIIILEHIMSNLICYDTTL